MGRIRALHLPWVCCGKRQVSYQWRLREVMATHGMFTITDLVPLLIDRGIIL